MEDRDGRTDVGPGSGSMVGTSVTRHAVPGHPDTGEAALRALEDIHFVRTLLDTAELNAVRTARAHSRSWSEIAVALHLSKQAAWESGTMSARTLSQRPYPMVAHRHEMSWRRRSHSCPAVAIVEGETSLVALTIS